MGLLSPEPVHRATLMSCLQFALARKDNPAEGLFDSKNAPGETCLSLRTGWTRVYIDRVDQGYLSCELMENRLQYSNRISQCTNSYQCFEMLKIRIKNPANAGLNQWLGGDLNSRPWGYESHALTS